MNCPNCNHPNPPEARDCARCGSALPPVASAVVQATQNLGEQTGGQAAAVWFAQAANVTVNVSYASAVSFAGSERARRYLRMLAVIAAPVANSRCDGPPDGPPLDVWGEWERLRGAIESTDPVTRAAAPWAVVRLAEPTVEGLRDALAPYDPGYQVVHFSCHGCPDGVWLEDRLGRERLLPTAELVAALRRNGSQSAPPASSCRRSSLSG